MKKSFPILLISLFMLFIFGCQFSGEAELVHYREQQEQPGDQTASDIAVDNSPTNESLWQESEFVTARIIAQTKYIRSGPGSGYGGRGFLSKNQEVILYAKNPEETWFLIDDSQSAWIYNDYLEIDGDLDKIPIFTEGMVFAPLPSEEVSIGSLSEEASQVIEQSSPEVSLSLPMENPPNISISELSSVILGAGGLEVYGEITNIGETAIKNIEVTLLFSASDSKETLGIKALVLSPWHSNIFQTGLVYPNEKIPFGAYIQKVKQSDTIRVFVKCETLDSREEKQNTDPIIVDSKIEGLLNDDPYNYSISGVILNEGSAKIHSTWIAATLYDGENRVIGMEEIILDSINLKPNEEKPFQIKLTSYSNVEGYTLLIRQSADISAGNENQ